MILLICKDILPTAEQFRNASLPVENPSSIFTQPPLPAESEHVSAPWASVSLLLLKVPMSVTAFFLLPWSLQPLTLLMLCVLF